MTNQVIHYKGLQAASGIYEIRHTDSGKRYVGSAKCLKLRLGMHLKDLRKNSHPNRYLQFAWNKYGEGSFCIRPIICCSANDLLFYEQLVLDAFWDELYNLAPTAGSQLGWVMPDVTKENISKAKLGKSISMPPFTDEHRANLSKAFTGRVVSNETRKRQSDAHKQRKRKPHRPTAKKNISLAKMGTIPWNKGKTGVYSDEALVGMSREGMTHSPETRQKMSDSHKGLPNGFEGKKHTPEARELIAIAGTGRVQSDETRQKRAESIKLWWAVRKSEQNKVVRYAY